MNSTSQTLDSSGPDETSRLEPFEVIDGYKVNMQGEVIGLAEIPPGEADERFTIRDEDAANWVLSLRMAEEAKILAIEARRAAINANLDGMLVGPRDRLKYLGWRFDNDLIAWAKGQLETIRGKTVKLFHGTIAFRDSKGSASIKDPAKALAYVQEWAPSRIRPMAVGVNDVIEAMKIETAADQEPETGDFFEHARARETATIKTGIGGKG